MVISDMTSCAADDRHLRKGKFERRQLAAALASMRKERTFLACFGDGTAARKFAKPLIYMKFFLSSDQLTIRVERRFSFIVGALKDNIVDPLLVT